MHLYVREYLHACARDEKCKKMNKTLLFSTRDAASDRHIRDDRTLCVESSLEMWREYESKKKPSRNRGKKSKKGRKERKKKLAEKEFTTSTNTFTVVRE